MAMWKKIATIASLATEDYSRKLEQGDFTSAYPEAEALMRPGKHKGTLLALVNAIKRNDLLEEKGSLFFLKPYVKYAFMGRMKAPKKLQECSHVRAAIRSTIRAA